MPEPTEQQKLRDLEAKLDAIKAQQAGETHHMEDHHAQAHLAWRMVIELVTGLGIGFGIGYGLDGLLGTTPWLMILFILLGLFAGVKTMMRSADEIQKKELAKQAKNDDAPEADG